MFENHLSGAKRSRTIPDPNRRFSLTLRDREVIIEVFLQRAIARRHLVALGYFGSVSVANSRLRRLFDGGYVRRVFIAAGAFATESVYIAGRAAVGEIVSTLGISKSEVERLVGQGAPQFLAHAISVSDVKVALTKHCHQGMTLDWRSEPECRHEFNSRNGATVERHVFKPDGAMIMTLGDLSHLYFLEVDKGNVSIPQFRLCAASYKRWIGLGLSDELYGATTISILCVTTGGARRIAHLAQAAKNQMVLMHFTTLAELEAEPYGRIWRSSNSGELIGVFERMHLL